MVVRLFLASIGTNEKGRHDGRPFAHLQVYSYQVALKPAEPLWLSASEFRTPL